MKTNAQKVNEVIHSVAESFRPQLIDHETHRLTKIIDRIKAHDGIVYDEEFDADFFGGFRNALTRIEVGLQPVEWYRDRDNHVLRFYRLDMERVDAIIKSLAACYAQMVVRDFEDKVSDKLHAIITSKIDLLTRVEHKGSIRRNWIAFEFADGSSFQTIAQIVHASRSGRFGWTQYRRYPLTFHRVFVKGIAMRMPSEAKVKEWFAGVKAEPKVPVVHAIGTHFSRMIGRKVGACVASGVGAQRFSGMTTEDRTLVTCAKCRKSLRIVDAPR